MISQTSLLAYRGVLPHLGKRQLEVFEGLKLLSNASDKELADFLGLKINQVTPRRGELLLKRVITFAYITCRNGSSEHTWEVEKEFIGGDVL